MRFNGETRDYLRVNLGLFRPPTPPIDFTVRPLRRGGARTRRKRFTDMTLPVPVTIRSKMDLEEVKRDIAKWLYHPEPQKLEFEHHPGTYYLAEYESLELTEKHKYAKGTINFYLGEAYRFGADKKVELSAGSGQVQEIIGDIEVPWVSTTTFTKATSQYTLSCELGYIEINFPFSTGDTLKLGYNKREVLLNGSPLGQGLSLLSEWFMLEPGELTFQASASTSIEYTARHF